MSSERRPSFGQSIRDARLWLNTTQKSVADQLGLNSASGYCRVEKGIKPASARILEPMMDILKIRPALRLRVMFEGMWYDQADTERMLAAPELVTTNNIPFTEKPWRENPYLTFQELVQFFITRDNMPSQQAMAERGQIDQGYISHLKNGDRNIRDRNMISKLSTGLQVPINNLAQFHATARFSPLVVASAIRAHRVAIGLDRAQSPLSLHHILTSS